MDKPKINYANHINDGKVYSYDLGWYDLKCLQNKIWVHEKNDVPKVFPPKETR